MQGVVLILALLGFVSRVSAECPNGCSGYGTCNAYDTCTCDAKHMGNDCSQRMCQFGKAHSDIAKGDLNGDGVVTGPDDIVIVNSEKYRYGTTEGFPHLKDTDLTTITETAHEWAECSAKGYCDRATGECQCFPSYDGAACQRASCPGYPDSCSGHGVCKTIKQLAVADYGNMYELWDEDATMGCECDSGYYGADCSLRKCKSGQDPLYEDDVSQRKLNGYFVGMFNDAARGNITNNTYDAFTDGSVDRGAAAFRFVYTDSMGKEWETGKLNDGASCWEVINAFNSIPQNVLPAGSVRCDMVSFDKVDLVNNTGLPKNHPMRELNDPLSGAFLEFTMKTFYHVDCGSYDLNDLAGLAECIAKLPAGMKTRNSTVNGHVYSIRILTNGRSAPIYINTYLDGNIGTVKSWTSDQVNRAYTVGYALGEIGEDGQTVAASADPQIIIYSDGLIAESKDFFGDYCAGVAIQIDTVGMKITMSPDQKELLKKCLGDSDGYSENNIGLSNYDKGNKFFPHIVKITKRSKNADDDSDYLVISYNESEFVMHHPYRERDFYGTGPQYGSYTNNYYDVHTTKGTLKLSSDTTALVASPGLSTIFTINMNGTAITDVNEDQFTGDLSCENQNNRVTPESSVTNDNFYISDTAHFNNTLHPNYGTNFASCVEKGDWLVLLGATRYASNPAYINFYKVERVNQYDGLTTQKELTFSERFDHGFGNRTSNFMLNNIVLDHAVNFLRMPSYNYTNGDSNYINVYKFHPHVESTYNVFAECSNRGLCDTSSGICECFKGYEGDACSIQSVTSI